MSQIRIFTANAAFGNYAEFAVDLAYQLYLRGVRVRLEGVSAAEVEWLVDSPVKEIIVKVLLSNDLRESEEKIPFLHICPANQIQPDKSYRNIAWLQYPGDKIPSSWPEHLEAVDEIIVPSQFNKWAFTKDGRVAEDKVRVLPVGVDQRLYTEDVEPYVPEDFPDLLSYPVRIIAALDYEVRRASINMLYISLKLIETIGSDKCCLVLFAPDLKVISIETAGRYVELLRKSLIDKGMVTDAPFKWCYVPAEVSRKQLPRVLRAGTHYLSASLSESWDALALRAAGVGRHLFVPNHTWYNCWIPESCATLLPISEKLSAHLIDPRVEEGTNWYGCNLVASYLTLMSNVIDSSIVLEKRSNMKHHLEQACWARTIDSYLEVLH